MSERLNRRSEGGSQGDSNLTERKQSIYFRGDTLSVLKEEAARLDRSLSWVVQKCVLLSLDQLRDMPSATGERLGGEDAQMEGNLGSDGE